MRTVLIRTDGDHSLGMGHVYRSVSIADEIRRRRFGTVIVTKSRGLDRVIPRRHRIRRITGSPGSIRRAVREEDPAVSVIDKLEVGTEELKILAAGSSTVGIDYTGKNKRLLGRGINMLYQRTGLSGRNSFSGFEYTVLNRRMAGLGPIRVSKDVRRVLVMQGGADTYCYTPAIIRALGDVPGRFTVGVVAGISFKCWRELDAAIAGSPHRVRTYHNAKNMGPIMSGSDMAVTAGGVSSLELCHLGVPSVIVCGESFEAETASLLQGRGFGTSLGFRRAPSRRKIAAAVEGLMKDHARRRSMNRAGRALVDGRGTERTVDRILEVAG
ncbi:conserved hypothetical protein [Nitrosopumilaceae archaeon]|nr:conserved hypothetical protein [Nitrosopumilaceae archaeon]